MARRLQLNPTPRCVLTWNWTITSSIRISGPQQSTGNLRYRVDLCPQTIVLVPQLVIFVRYTFYDEGNGVDVLLPSASCSCLTCLLHLPTSSVHLLLRLPPAPEFPRRLFAFLQARARRLPV